MINFISHIPLDTYTKVAMVIFFGIFVLVTYRVLREPRAEMAHHAAMPLDDEETSNG